MRKTIISLGLLIALVIVVNLIRFWPDGKLHITFCDVGQGDASYIRFPNGQDLLIDGGPDRKVLECLSQAMPFYDHALDVVMLTHPQADHLNGLVDVVGRYTVGYFITPPVGNATEGYKRLIETIQEKRITVKNLYWGSSIRFGSGRVDIIWPEKEWVLGQVQSAKCQVENSICLGSHSSSQGSEETADSIVQGGVVLGASTRGDLNHFSIIAHLVYGQFDALFTGDSDSYVERAILDHDLALGVNANNPIEVLKVPHHGSKTGMISEFLDRIHASVGVIEVGAKNRYGHPTKEALTLLSEKGIRVFRTDQDGTVEVVSDGKTWEVKSNYSKSLK